MKGDVVEKAMVTISKPNQEDEDKQKDVMQTFLDQISFKQ